MRFESDINGYAYILREDPKGTEFLYPAPVKVAPKRGKKDRTPEALPRDTGKVEAHQFIDIPMGQKGFAYRPQEKRRPNFCLSFAEKNTRTRGSEREKPKR